MSDQTIRSILFDSKLENLSGELSLMRMYFKFDNNPCTSNLIMILRNVESHCDSELDKLQIKLSKKEKECEQIRIEKEDLRWFHLSNYIVGKKGFLEGRLRSCYSFCYKLEQDITDLKQTRKTVMVFKKQSRDLRDKELDKKD
eukprot:UN04383